MPVEDDQGGDDLMFLAIVAAGAYIVYQFWRDRLAASIGGGVFQNTPPPSDPTQSILNYLVPLQLSPTGAAFIKGQEQFRANAYPDGQGKMSIGWGHQIQPGENFVQPITRTEADSIFASDVAGAEKTVSDSVLVQISQSQFDALTDLAYNIGRSAFLNSTLLQLLNQGDFAGAAAQFSQWVHSGGQVSPVLQARRSADLNTFQGG